MGALGIFVFPPMLMALLGSWLTGGSSPDGTRAGSALHDAPLVLALSSLALVLAPIHPTSEKEYSANFALTAYSPKSAELQSYTERYAYSQG